MALISIGAQDLILLPRLNDNENNNENVVFLQRNNIYQNDIPIIRNIYGNTPIHHQYNKIQKYGYGNCVYQATKLQVFLKVFSH